jgi:ferredoxin
MKTILYYFSGTGNSLQIAKDIATQIGDTQLVRIQKPFPGKPDAAVDRIGIVFPVYMWGLPLAVKEFVEQLEANPSTYIFAVTTYGGFPAGTLRMLDELLQTRGMRLSAGFGIKMPGNYTPMYGATPLKKQQKDFAAAARKISSLVETVKAGKTVPVKKTLWLIDILFSRFIYAGGSKQIRSSDKQFFTLDTCTRCGTCARVCPVENITLVDGKPHWQGHCEQCLACLQWCPVEAIQFTKKTVGRTRYHHPAVLVSDFFKK